MTRTLITGIAGFTGRYVASLLADRGHEIHGILHGDQSGAVTDAWHVYNADVADFSAVDRVIREVRPDYVLHLAGIAFPTHSDVAEIYRSNVIGTRQLLEALSRLAAPPRSVLLVSSASVYGNADCEVIRECANYAPASDYGVSKVALEYVARLYTASLPIVIARPFNYTGRGQSSQFLIPKIVEHARRRSTSIELGNLDVSRDFSDVRDVADIYARLLAEPTAIGGTYNVCSGKSVSLREVLGAVQSLSGHQLDVRVNPAFVRANEVYTQRGSKVRLESVIGPARGRDFEETLSWMLRA